MEIKWERARKQRDTERERECVCELGWMAAIASVVNGQLENTSVGTNKIIAFVNVSLISKMRNLATGFSHG